ncbi:uncharacterized protein F4812DRAFT_258547 [Daldinia caldariorum]|uniref:uncharacterized protein n=1 Tax=Daldinia caldariorum TaxID=326644 RepID=UPI002008D1D0|nr:uncharacterized protein F4812DRAFT_258547 [Daldinia caldariorum]KAI1470259.1 hypothetical protein F4812DRAFT_258547 [Daldinia caldariorum]
MVSIWRRACVGCTKSKRQCTKTVPACRRCATRGIPCIYLPARQGNNRQIDAGTDLDVAAAMSSAPAGGSANLLPMISHGNADGIGSGDIDCYPLQLTQSDLVADMVSRAACGPQPSTGDNSSVVSTGLWFLAPESWVTDRGTCPDMTVVTYEPALQRFIGSVQDWLRRWVTDGGSPLHHHHLYREKMPRCVQDAHSAVALYHMTTCSNAETRARTARVIEDRVTQLLADQALDDTLRTGEGMDIFDHICRVQSLLTYQTIRLLDGDIRMRTQAEALIPTLFLWTQQLLDSTKNSLTQPARFLADIAASCPAAASSDDVVLWSAWILVESTRRTWLIATYLQETYLYMKRGWGECPGRVPNTMHSRLWEATSAYAWSKACREADTVLISTQRADKLLYEMKFEDVDEFSLLIMEIRYGTEEIERWIEDSKRRHKQPILEIL